MKAELLKVSTTQNLQSFNIRKDLFPNINNRWHYHQEVELIQIHAGTGMQFVGDSMKQFSAGDVILVGSNLPHYWRYDDARSKSNSKSTVYSTVVHFMENVWGDRFLNLPEMRSIKMLLEKSKQGILIRGAEGKSIGALIEKIYMADGLQKLMALVECLSVIASCKTQKQLSSIGFSYDYSDYENNRMNTIYNYTLKNFNRKIDLAEIASKVGLVPNSFCRYFKTRTRKTFSQFIAEIRIGHASKLLIENKVNIKQICFDSGFNNHSCFHKKFKSVTGKTPLQYQEEILAKA